VQSVFLTDTVAIARPTEIRLQEYSASAAQSLGHSAKADGFAVLVTVS
jgi:hypothetical protein